MHSQICLVARTKPPAPPNPTQGGGSVGRGPPALRGVFLSIFFLRRRRKNMAPGGRQPYCMENIKTQKPASQKKSPKPQPQCVSYSAATSGLHTSSQGTDALTSLPGSRNPPTHASDPHPRGWVHRAGSPPRLARRLSFHILSSLEKKEWSPRRALAILPGSSSNSIQKKFPPPSSSSSPAPAEPLP